MLSAQLLRWTGLALLLGGLSIALFVLLLFPVGGFFGAARALNPLWVPAHSFHLIGALLLLPGVTGLYWRQFDETGPLGAIGFAMAFVGTALFVGTGMLTAFLFPVLAVIDPASLAPGGMLYALPTDVLFGVTILTLIPGYVLLGLATFMAGVLPRGGALLIMIGVVLANTPPPPTGPLPWAVIVLGGVLFGVGAMWLGYSIWSHVPLEPQRRPAEQVINIDTPRI